MPRHFRPPALLGPVALSAALALTARADAGPARFTGVTWQPPAGMEVTDASLHNCPGRCVVDEGNGTGATDDFPLLRVHEAVVGDAPSTPSRLIAWMRGDRGEVVRLLKSGSERVGQGTVARAVFARADDAQDDDPDSSLFVLVEQGTAVSGANVGGGVGNDGAAVGRWSYDPASFTLAYGAARKERNVDWTLLGKHDWWKK